MSTKFTDAEQATLAAIVRQIEISMLDKPRLLAELDVDNEPALRMRITRLKKKIENAGGTSAPVTDSSAAAPQTPDGKKTTKKAVTPSVKKRKSKVEGNDEEPSSTKKGKKASKELTSEDGMIAGDGMMIKDGVMEDDN